MDSRKNPDLDALQGFRSSKPLVSPSKVRKLTNIGIKLPIVAAAAAAQEEKKPSAEGEQSRVCEICKKSFSSGRALGGHMRIHTQLPHSHSHSHCLPQRNNQNPTCPVCDKNFPSMKSLFGHMRCHPERHWRGIQPPTPTDSSDSALSHKESSSDANHHHHQQLDSSLSTTAPSPPHNLADSISGWSLKAKRGRSPIISASASASSSSPEDRKTISDAEAHAAYHLMMLSYRDPPTSDLSSHSNSNTNSKYIQNPQKLGDASKKRSSDHEDESQSQEYPPSLPKKLKIHVASEDPMNRFKVKADDYHRSVVPNSDNPSSTRFAWDYNAAAGAGLDHRNQLHLTSEMILSQKLKKHKRRMKRMKIRKLKRSLVEIKLKRSMVEKGSSAQHNPRTTALCGFKCRTCNKTFSSHQALGGHRASHTIAKNSVSHLDKTAISGQKEDRDQETQSQSQSSHRCKFCNKVFSTGPALGGHQKLHWRKAAEAVPSISMESPKDINKKTSRVPLDFDLNELPVPTVEDL